MLFGEAPLVGQRQNGLSIHSPSAGELNFTDRVDLTPKQFLHEKQPQTDIERVVCLAYYLTHYRDTPHFKTLDISKLNTEAAQIKLSNATMAVNNTSTKGLITIASKGSKQISAYGEEYVTALPDRDAAKKIIAKMNSRKRKKRSASKKKK